MFESTREIMNFIEDSKNAALLEDSLLGLTTPKERVEFARRIEIAKRLIRGDTHHQIAQELKVGVATVSRGSRELAQGRFKVLLPGSKQKPQNTGVNMVGDAGFEPATSTTSM